MVRNNWEQHSRHIKDPAIVLCGVDRSIFIPCSILRETHIQQDPDPSLSIIPSADLVERDIQPATDPIFHPFSSFFCLSFHIANHSSLLVFNLFWNPIKTIHIVYFLSSQLVKYKNSQKELIVSGTDRLQDRPSAKPSTRYCPAEPGPYRGRTSVRPVWSDRAYNRVAPAALTRLLIVFREDLVCTARWKNSVLWSPAPRNLIQGFWRNFFFLILDSLFYLSDVSAAAAKFTGFGSKRAKFWHRHISSKACFVLFC